MVWNGRRGWRGLVPTGQDRMDWQAARGGAWTGVEGNVRRGKERQAWQGEGGVERREVEWQAN